MDSRQTAMTLADERMTCFLPRRLSSTDDSIVMINSDCKAMDMDKETSCKNFLCCSLCHGKLVHPKLLPCIHTFCQACLSRYNSTKNKAEDSSISFRCPECGQPVEKEESKFLPDNILARRLSFPLTSTDHQEMQCNKCQKNELMLEAKFRCVNCCENMCDVCASEHTSEAETMSHKVEKLLSIPLHCCGKDDDNNPTGTENNDTDFSESTDRENKHDCKHTSCCSEPLRRCCPRYDAYDIDVMFCVDCDLALCVDCHKTHETDHRCAELSAVAQNFTAKIHDPLEALRIDSQILSRTLAKHDATDILATKINNEAEVQIRNRAHELIKLIMEHEQILLKQVEHQTHLNKNIINRCRISTRQRLSSIDAVTTMSEMLTQYGSEEEKVALRRKIGRRVRQLCEMDLPDNCVKIVRCKFHLPWVNLKKIINDIFGRVSSGNTNSGSDLERQSLATT